MSGQPCRGGHVGGGLGYATSYVFGEDVGVTIGIGEGEVQLVAGGVGGVAADVGEVGVVDEFEGGVSGVGGQSLGEGPVLYAVGDVDFRIGVPDARGGVIEELPAIVSRP